MKPMQSDAFPTPPIYCHYFEPLLSISHSEQDLPSQAQYVQDLPTRNERKSDKELRCNQLLNEIELLITDSAEEQSQSFWIAANRLKLKHQIMESMQKIENLFLDLAKESTQDPDLITAVSEGLLYTSIHSAK